MFAELSGRVDQRDRKRKPWEIVDMSIRRLRLRGFHAAWFRLYGKLLVQRSEVSIRSPLARPRHSWGALRWFVRRPLKQRASLIVFPRKHRSRGTTY